MSNTFFKFKQFTIHQSKCAMKVGTDGVLLGAWVKPDYAESILDVGTGTGLIALMLAQRTEAKKIIAIDVEEDACKQALENVDMSPWRNRIEVVHSSLQDFGKGYNQKFDLIVSNPPYFENSLLAPNQSRTVARHTIQLSFEDLIGFSSMLLTDTGKLCIIFPYELKEKIVQIAEQNKLFISRCTNVLPVPDSIPKRVLIEFSKSVENYKVDKLIVESGGRHIYSDEYIQLTKDYYLNM